MTLAQYLKDRRTRLDPKAFGIAATRRRTAGLRREEVAQRANVSATWYTWLEQGRGGAPSADVLDRIARALELTATEREHLFLLAQNRPPEVQYRASGAVTPRLQRVLDALELSPALVKTSTWDIVAWNRAATAVFADYQSLPAEQRNVLRLMFCDPNVRALQTDWTSVARFVVAAFRADVARAGASTKAQALIDDLRRISPEFNVMWGENDVEHYGEGTKRLRHSTVGMIAFDYSAFAVDGQPDLSMVVYTPATPGDANGVRALIQLQSCEF